MKKILLTISFLSAFLIFTTISNEVDLNQESVQNSKFDVLNEVEIINYYNYKDTDIVDVTIIFKEESLLDKYISSNQSIDIQDYILNNKSSDTYAYQNQFLSSIDEEVLITKNYDVLFNGVSCKTTFSNIEKLKQYEEIENVIIEERYLLPETETLEFDAMYDTGIYDSSDLDYDGEGMLVAILDSGFNVNHSVFSLLDDYDYKYSESDIKKLNFNNNYYNTKIPFRFDYSDNGYGVESISDHGQHVAGIISGDDSVITGVAPKAQLALMKVSNDSGSIADEYIYSALEDAIVLGVDSINISIGASGGFSTESDKESVNKLFEKIHETGISLCISAGNSYSSSYGNNNGGYNSTDNPDLGIIGSPSSYVGSTTIASCSSTEQSSYIKINDKEIYYQNVFNNNSQLYNFDDFMNTTEQIKNAEFISINSYGYEEDYNNINVSGKFVLVQRGEITFETKVDNAKKNNAIGVILYDANSDLENISIGDNKSIPVIMVNKELGLYLESINSSTFYYSSLYTSGLLMSEFSSWGPLPSLEFEPDITAPGGYIYSSITEGYAIKSGTSMASPNLCGLTVLTRQYINDKFSIDKVESATMISQLLMSTTEILYDQYGNPYSVRKQGAGLADIYDALSTEAYLSVIGETKTKIELFDDPEKVGIYTFSFQLNNISSKSLTYNLDEIVMTETINNNLIAQRAYLLNSNTTYSGNDVNGKTVVVNANSVTTINVTITLSNEDKLYLDNFENGIYVEGWIKLKGDNELSIPFLGFYGDWSDSDIFDKTIYDDEDASIFPCFVTTTIDGVESVFGEFSYNYDEDTYTELKTNYDNLTISDLDKDVAFSVYFGMLRGAEELTLIFNSENYYKEFDSSYCVPKNYYNSTLGYSNYYCLGLYINPKSFEFENGDTFEIILRAKLDYDTDSTQELKFTITIDVEDPILNEYNVYKTNDRTYLDLNMSDNTSIEAIRLAVKNNSKYTYLDNYYIPVIDDDSTIDITQYIDKLNVGEELVVLIYDYAGNYSEYTIDTVTKFELTNNYFEIELGESLDLNDVIVNYSSYSNLTILLSNDYCKLNNNYINTSQLGECIVYIYYDGDEYSFVINVVTKTPKLDNYSTYLINRLNLIDELSLDDEDEVKELRELYSSITDEEQLTLLSDFLEKLEEYEERMIVLKEYKDLLEVYSSSLSIEINQYIDLKSVLVNFEQLTSETYKFSNDNCSILNKRIYGNSIGDTVLTISIENVSVTLIISVTDITPDESTSYIISLINTLPNKITLDDKAVIIQIRNLVDEVEDENQLIYLESYIEKLFDYEAQLVVLDKAENNFLFNFSFDNLIPDNIPIWVYGIVALLGLYFVICIFGKMFGRK